MPRPARRAAVNADTDEQATTPTRRNPITATIPPFMLDTPDRAPFINTQQPAHNPNESIVPTGDDHANTTAPRRHRNQGTPAARTDPDGDDQGPDGSQASTHALTAPSEAGERSYLSSVQLEAEDARALAGLRDISSLATWQLSSAKPGCALAQLRSPSATNFWQSDGPQPHTLTLHFFKLVAIVKMRMYSDFELDESYTPTKVSFWAGMSEGSLVQFGEWSCVDETDPETGETRSSVESVKGWIDIDLKGVGGREKRYHEVASVEGGDDPVAPGDVLKAMVVQMRIHENHQNGKDCHVRGFQVFSRDESMARDGAKMPLRKGEINRLPTANLRASERRLASIWQTGWAILRFDDP